MPISDFHSLLKKELAKRIYVNSLDVKLVITPLKPKGSLFYDHKYEYHIEWDRLGQKGIMILSELTKETVDIAIEEIIASKEKY
jgi:hypothetical protein